jgi:quercetin dioxygenase-like cupin family protein
LNCLTKYPTDFVCEGVIVDEFNLSQFSNLFANFKVAEFQLEPGSQSSVDSHSVQEIWIVTHGAGLLHSNGKTKQLTQGNAVHFPSHIDHWIENNGTTQLRLITIWW